MIFPSANVFLKHVGTWYCIKSKCPKPTFEHSFIIFGGTSSEFALLIWYFSDFQPLIALGAPQFHDALCLSKLLSTHFYFF